MHFAAITIRPLPLKIFHFFARTIGAAQEVTYFLSKRASKTAGCEAAKQRTFVRAFLTRSTSRNIKRSSITRFACRARNV